MLVPVLLRRHQRRDATPVLRLVRGTRHRPGEWAGLHRRAAPRDQQLRARPDESASGRVPRLGDVHREGVRSRICPDQPGQQRRHSDRAVCGEFEATGEDDLAQVAADDHGQRLAYPLGVRLRLGPRRDRPPGRPGRRLRHTADRAFRSARTPHHRRHDETGLRVRPEPDRTDHHRFGDADRCHRLEGVDRRTGPRAVLGANGRAYAVGEERTTRRGVVERPGQVGSQQVGRPVHRSRSDESKGGHVGNPFQQGCREPVTDRRPRRSEAGHCNCWPSPPPGTPNVPVSSSKGLVAIGHSSVTDMVRLT